MHSFTVPLVRTLATLAVGGLSLLAAQSYTSGDGSMTVDVDTSHTIGGGAPSSSSGSGGPSINPAAWSGPGGWTSQRPPPASPATTVTDASANQQSLEAHDQAYLQHQWYLKGQTLFNEGKYDQAEQAFRTSIEHGDNAKAKHQAAESDLERKNAEARLAIGCCKSADAHRLMNADLLGNAAQAITMLEAALKEAPTLDEARQSLLRARGAVAEAKGRAHIDAKRWPEAVVCFKESAAFFDEAVTRDTANTKRTKGNADQAFSYRADAAKIDLERVRLCTASSLSGVAHAEEKAGRVHEAYTAAKQASDLSPNDAKLKAEAERLARIPVQITPPAQGGVVETKP